MQERGQRVENTAIELTEASGHQMRAGDAGPCRHQRERGGKKDDGRCPTHCCLLGAPHEESPQALARKNNPAAATPAPKHRTTTSPDGNFTSAPIRIPKRCNRPVAETNPTP